MPVEEGYTFKFIGWNKDVPGVDFDHLNVGVNIQPVFEKIQVQ